MSSIIDTVYYPLWISHPVLQTGLAALMFKRKLLSRYRSFFGYLLAEVMIFGVLFASQQEYTYYYYLYWIGTGISVFFGFWVIYEVFTDVLHPFHALRDFTALLFRWLAVLVLLIAVVAALNGHDEESTRLSMALLSLERSVRVMQCGLVMFLLMFSRYLGISRRHPSFGIALGFGMFAGIDLAVLALRQAGAISGTDLNIFYMAAYNVSLLVWGAYLFKPQVAMRKAEDMLRSQRWDMSLGELTRPVAPESLMPMFDAMVDRAFSRSGSPDGARGQRDPVAGREPELKPKPSNPSPAKRDTKVGPPLVVASRKV